MSAAEDLLAWQLTQAGILFAREHRFFQGRQWRFDFALGGCAVTVSVNHLYINTDKLAVEVDGGTWAQGRHTRGKGFEADCEKGNEALILGWRVLHVTPAMVEDGRALRWIERAMGR